MQSFKTLFEAILTAEELLKSAVQISDANGRMVTFSCLSQKEHYSCIINDGYERFMEDGKVKMRKHVESVV
jgi:hypothetical protein